MRDTAKLLRFDPDQSDPGIDIRQPVNGQRRIGAIMIDLGLLQVEQAEQVLDIQRGEGGRFGDLAVSLGFLRKEQVMVALARQRALPTLMPDDLARLDSDLRSAIEDSGSLRAYTDARTQLELRWFDDAPERRTLAVISDGPREGRTLTASAVGLLLAMTGRRVLLIDACAGSGRLASIFGVEKKSLSLSEAISSPDRALRLKSTLDSLDLAVLSAHEKEFNADTAASRGFASLLATVAGHWDAVIVDTPAWSVDRTAFAVSVRCSGALISVRLGHSRLDGLSAIRRHLADGGVERIGAVVQRF